jgi:hypothetical protein
MTAVNFSITSLPEPRGHTQLFHHCFSGTMLVPFCSFPHLFPWIVWSLSDFSITSFLEPCGLSQLSPSSLFLEPCGRVSCLSSTFFQEQHSLSKPFPSSLSLNYMVAVTSFPEPHDFSPCCASHLCLPIHVILPLSALITLLWTLTLKVATAVFAKHIGTSSNTRHLVSGNNIYTINKISW